MLVTEPNPHGGFAKPCTVPGRGTVTTGRTSNTGADDDEREALRAEGLDPDDPAVIAAIDLVRWELSFPGDDLGVYGDYRPMQF